MTRTHIILIVLALGAGIFFLGRSSVGGRSGAGSRLDTIRFIGKSLTQGAEGDHGPAGHHQSHADEDADRPPAREGPLAPDHEPQDDR